MAEFQITTGVGVVGFGSGDLLAPPVTAPLCDDRESGITTKLEDIQIGTDER